MERVDICRKWSKKTGSAKRTQAKAKAEYCDDSENEQLTSTNHNHSTSSAAPASTTASTAPTTLWPLTFVPALVVVLPVVDVPLAAVPVLDFVPVAEEPAPVLVEPDAEVDETTVAVGILEMVDHVPPGGRH